MTLAYDLLRAMIDFRRYLLKGQVRPFLAARFLAMPELSGFLPFPLSIPLPLV